MGRNLVLPTTAGGRARLHGFVECEHRCAVESGGELPDPCDLMTELGRRLDRDHLRILRSSHVHSDLSIGQAGRLLRLLRLLRRSGDDNGRRDAEREGDCGERRSDRAW